MGAVEAIECWMSTVCIAFKSPEPIEQQICIKFCIRLEYSSTETIWMIQKATAMGNWWQAASSQHACSCITSYAKFLAKHQITWVTQWPLQARFGTLQLLAFPKAKITFEREEISDCWWDSGKFNGPADWDWLNYVKSQGAYFEVDWGVIVICTMFQASRIFFNKCLYFS